MRGGKITPATQWEKDKIKKKNIVELGFKLFIVWENEYLKNKQFFKEFLIKEIIKLRDENNIKENHELLSELF